MLHTDELANWWATLDDGSLYKQMHLLISLVFWYSKSERHLMLPGYSLVASGYFSTYDPNWSIHALLL